MATFAEQVAADVAVLVSGELRTNISRGEDEGTTPDIPRIARTAVMAAAWFQDRVREVGDFPTPVDGDVAALEITVRYAILLMQDAYQGIQSDAGRDALRGINAEAEEMRERGRATIPWQSLVVPTKGGQVPPIPEGSL